MKKRYKLFSVIFVLTILCSCTDYLDLPPKNEKALDGIEDVRSVLSGYLFNVDNANTTSTFPAFRQALSSETVMMFEAYSDNIDFENSIDTYLNPAGNYVVYPASDLEKTYANYFLFNIYDVPTTLWESCYTSIGFLNSLIDVMADVTDGTQKDSDRILGEMYTHRAFYFFKLLQYFAPMDNGELGIPVYLHTGEEVVGISMPRKSHAEVYKVILSDLNKALEMVERTDPQEDFNLFFSKRYINHLLSQVYWYKAESPAKEASDYENAKTHAQVAIEGTQSLIPTTQGDFDLMRSGLYSGYTAYTIEPFGFLTVAKIYGSQYYYFVNYGMEINPLNMAMNPDFVSSFSDTDIRKNYMLNPDGTLHVKYPNHSKKNFIHLFQPEDAYLILAEAHYKLGEEGTAISVLNEFKSFRNSGDATGLSGEELYQEIQKERRLEFFGTFDYRWIDLKRYANTAHTRLFTFFGETYDLSIAPNDYRYALPIPLKEIQENPDITPNPGWVQLEF